MGVWVGVCVWGGNDTTCTTCIVNEGQLVLLVTAFNTYPKLGILSAIPVIPAIRLQCEIITPFGTPVEPLVYIITAMSDGTGFNFCLVTGTEKN